ncbi:MAG: hypothetical protein P4L81_06335 [Candidatus Pacebacteria bacterium]|nr:hypothetical protein [Candidatus Paceibacterota bacterium]
MSHSDDFVTPKRCCYVFRQGKNKGNRCSYHVSKKDIKGPQCSQHYYRHCPPLPEISEKEPVPTTADEKKITDRDSDSDEDSDEEKEPVDDQFSGPNGKPSSLTFPNGQTINFEIPPMIHYDLGKSCVVHLEGVKRKYTIGEGGLLQDLIQTEDKEKRWEERYLKEREQQQEEKDYRTWRNKRMARP